MKEQVKKEFYASYEIGDVVYHKINGEKGIIVAYSVDKRDVMYKITFGLDYTNYFYAIELTKEKPVE